MLWCMLVTNMLGDVSTLASQDRRGMNLLDNRMLEGGASLDAQVELVRLLAPNECENVKPINWGIAVALIDDWDRGNVQ
jgi:hypothetical protein